MLCAKYKHKNAGKLSPETIEIMMKEDAPMHEKISQKNPLGDCWSPQETSFWVSSLEDKFRVSVSIF